MKTLEIFVDGDKMYYTEVEKICYDATGSWVVVDFAIRIRDLEKFLAMSDDEDILLSPECPERDPYFKPLEAKRKRIEIESFLVFEEWRTEKTPAIALYQRDEKGSFALRRLIMQTADIPQLFWEIVYPSACVRISAKVRRHFFPECISMRYFIGRETQTLYVVDSSNSSSISLYFDERDAGGCSKTEKYGLRDGLKASAFHKSSDGWYDYFNMKEALEGTSYSSQLLVYPDDIMALVHKNEEVKLALGEILTGEEMRLL